jgi:hypothetical protein
MSEIAAENRKIVYERTMTKNQFIFLHNLSLSEPAQNAALQGECLRLLRLNLAAFGAKGCVSE